MGEKWFQCEKAYYDQANKQGCSRLKVTTEKRRASFKYGNGGTNTVDKYAKIPAHFGSVHRSFAGHVVPGEVVGLLGLDALRRGKAIIDCSKDVMTFYGEEVPLIFTDSGHYGYNIRITDWSKWKRRSAVEVLNIAEISDLSDEINQVHIVYWKDVKIMEIMGGLTQCSRPGGSRRVAARTRAFHALTWAIGGMEEVQRTDPLDPRT